MILIISNQNDDSTTKMIDWLEYYSKKWIRINENDVVRLIFFGNDVLFDLSDSKFFLSEISSYWYRRGRLNFNFHNLIIKHSSVLTRFQVVELEKITEYIYYLIRQKKTINTFENSDVNKLIVSHEARKLGISTPKDLLFSTKEHLFENTKEGKYITKPISGDSIQRFDNFSIFNYTTLLDKDKVKSETFFPSLVQNQINKKYELRIFYIHGKLYSMAIFSQKDDQTSVDFRVYNKRKPNRNVPYQLPREEEEKLDKLMRCLNLNCGSIDMIVTPDNQYVFLEVNPIGQFGMVSYPCNYNLEKIIAEHL